MLYVSLLQLLRVQSIKAADVQTVLSTVPSFRQAAERRNLSSISSVCSSTLTPTQMTEFLTLSQRLSLNILPDAHFHHLVKVVLFC